MSTQPQLLQQASVLSSRQMVMLLIVGLHALLISGLMAMRIIPVAHKPETITIVDFLRQDPAPTGPLPDPQLKPRLLSPTTLDIPQPVLNIPVPVTPPIQFSATPNPPPLPGATVASAVVEVASTPLQFRAVRAADDYYPSASISLQEEGSSIVQVCVAPSGKLDGKPVIEESSGSSRLDAAALLWAREALRFTPATRGGVPVSACKGFRVNFTLH